MTIIVSLIQFGLNKYNYANIPRFALGDLKMKNIIKIKTSILLIIFIFIALLNIKESSAQDDIPLNIKQFHLDNGMQFIILERHTVPQVACRLAIRAGSALEEAGKTGIAHMLEHMMFKGTKNFGTTDLRLDEELQQKIDAAYLVLAKEQSSRNPDYSLIKEKTLEMSNLRDKVQKIFIPKALSAQLNRNGAIGVNAFTSTDQTQYTASVPSDMLEQWFSIISEQLFEPSWREFYIEKEIVQREWDYRYVNNPKGVAWLELFSNAYMAHPYHNPVIGWKSDMEKYSTEDAIRFHSSYYTPENAVAVFVGDTTEEEVRHLAEIYFARYPGKNSPAPEIVTKEPEQNGPRYRVRMLKGAKTPLVRLGFHGVSMNSKDFYALDMLTMILSSGRDAKYTRNIVNNGSAIEAWAYNPDNRYGGLIILGGVPNNPGQNASKSDYIKACEELEGMLLSEIFVIAKNGISDGDLDRVLTLAKFDFLNSLRSNESMASMLATSEIQTGWKYILDYQKNLSKVSADDIKRVANEYFKGDGITSIYVIPDGEPNSPGVEYSEVRSSGFGISTDTGSEFLDFNNISQYPTPDQWKHPLSFNRKPRKIIYPDADSFDVNGTKVFFIPSKDLPLVDLSILVKAGKVDIPYEKQGLEMILEEALLLGGSADISPEQLAEFLDSNAIDIDFSISTESSSINMSVLKEKWLTGTNILKDIVSKPAFKEKVLDILKLQAIAKLNMLNEDAVSIAWREAMVARYEGHPYGRNPLNGLNTIQNITRQDLLYFMDEYFIPSNMVIAISGDITRQDAETAVSSLIQALPQKSAPVRAIENPPKTAPKLILINKPGQIQSQIVFTLPSVKKENPKFWNIALLANIFGGSDSLMYTRLRDNLGLVYAAYFYQSWLWQAGLLNGYIGCKADQTVKALEETISLMRQIGSEFPDDLLELKRLDVLNSFVFNVDTPHSLVKTYAGYFMRQELMDTLSQIQDFYMHADKETLTALAKEYLTSDDIQIIVVCDKMISTYEDSRTSLDFSLKKFAELHNLSFVEIELK